MCDPKKIYNDAPDEFAEFLDSGASTVSLHKLAGIENPFVKTGIYKEILTESDTCTVCPHCGLEQIVSLTEEGRVSKKQSSVCEMCHNQFQVSLDEFRLFEIQHDVLAEFISQGVGCSICRQFKKTGWQFGKLRDYDVYFACSPTPGMYKALESTPKSVLIIGKNNPKYLPPSLATRVIYLSRLLFVNDGKLNFAPEAIEEKVPMPRHEHRRTEKNPEKPTKKHSRPPIQVYTPYYLCMICEWIDELRKKGQTGKPPFKWITRWLFLHCHIQGVAHVGERQVRRHVEKLIASTPDNPKRDKRSATFAVYWKECESERFVQVFSKKDVAKTITEAFDVAMKTGFKVSLMRGMDAADFADKVRTI